MKKYLLPLVLIVGLYAVLPLFRPGYIPTHDGEFSIIRIWQFHKVLLSGNILPRWAPDLNSGYGIPLFIFYYPLPYYVASAFHGIFSLVDSFKLTMAISYLTAIAASFFWLKKLFNRKAAAIGSLVALSVPYWFVDIYVRGSVGEVLGITWAIIALASIEYKNALLFAGAVAALILSHNIEAALFLPFLLLYIALRRKPFLGFLFLGIGVASFFWIPALFEQRFVLGLSNFDFRDHFPEFAQLVIPSWGTGFSGPGWPSGEMSQQVGIGVWTALLLSLVLVWKEKNNHMKLLVGGFLSFAALAIFLMLDVSTPVWLVLRPMKFIQYPWRMLSYFIPIAGMLSGYIAWKSSKIFLPVFLAAAALFFAFPYVQPVIYSPRPDSYYLTRKEFTDGTTSVGNSFSTLWLPWQSARSSSKIESSPNVAISGVQEDRGGYVLNLNATGDGWLKLNVSFFPGWNITIDNKKQRMNEESGVIGFTVPSGPHRVEARFGDTPIRQFAGILSLLSLFCLIGLGILGQGQYAYRHRNISSRKRT